MQYIYTIFYSGLRQLRRDGMLLLLVPLPLVLGIFNKYLLPIANTFIMDKINIDLAPYFAISDIIFIMLAPLFTVMISVFLMLDERDEGTSLYYSITPAAGYYYLIARLLLPMVAAWLMTVIVALFFSNQMMSLSSVLLFSLLAVLQGLIMALFVLSYADNKVEGLALFKVVNIMLFAFLPAWFLAAPIKYVFAVFPSFWLGELFRYRADWWLNGVLGLACCVFWSIVFFRKLLSKY